MSPFMFLLSFIDQINPTLVCPLDMIVSTPTPSWSPPRTANFPNLPDIFCDPSSGTVFELGQSLVTCSADDSEGISADCTFTLTVIGNCLIVFNLTLTELENLIHFPYIR